MDETVIANLGYLAEEESLREKVRLSEKHLDDLERDLRAIDSELEALQKKTHRYEVLAQVCRSLEELEDVGGTNLFWDGQSGPENPAEHLSNARRKIDEFAAEIARVEDRRLSICDDVDDQNTDLDYLHYGIRDVIEQQESIRIEWLVDRDADKLPPRSMVMPWARGFEEDRRFRKSVAASLLLCLAASMLFRIVDLPILDRSAVIQLPERIARLVREERTPPPPAPIAEPIIQDEELPEPEPQPEPEQEPEPAPQLVEELIPEALREPTEEPVVAEVQKVDTREQVKSKGILAFRESFASRATIRPAAQLGSQARISNAGENAIGRPTRSMVTTSAPGSSGGINLAAISRDVGGGGQGIEGVQLGQVASSIGGGEGPARPFSGGVSAGRTDEEIQIVFDRYKAALYRLYNRELRRDPTLRGQLVLRLTIEPDGSVSMCQIQSTDMDAAVLAERVVARVRNFDFGAKEDIVAITIVYPIDFLPSA
ncbi:MAG: AgmX/PglI C-terminal domain-containing protein [Chloroflexi bacterium]|nr:AgmX/PglI C-terminal domain-containing protein [Chloroflexota bacterium]